MKHTNLYTIAESMVAKLFNEDIEDVEKEHGITAHKPNPVVQKDEVKYADDYVQYTNKPGVIVAIVKGNTYSGIQQIPIGAVDNFRCMKITDEDAFMSQKDLANENETSKRYENLVQEYERSKSEVIEQWRKNNANTYNSLKSKYGNKLLGADIIQNDKRIQHKDDEVEKSDNDEDKKDDKSKELYNSGNEREDDKSIDETEQVDEGFGDFLTGLKNWWKNDKQSLEKTADYFNKHKDVMDKVVWGLKELKNKMDNEEDQVKAFDDIKIVANIPKKQINESDGKFFQTSVDKKSLTTMEYEGKKYLVLGTGLNNAASVKDLYLILKKNKISQISKDLSGIIIMFNDEYHDKYQSGKFEKSGSSAKQKNIALKGYPVNGVSIENNKLIFNTDITTISKRGEIDDIEKMFS